MLTWSTGGWRSSFQAAKRCRRRSEGQRWGRRLQWRKRGWVYWPYTEGHSFKTLGFFQVIRLCSHSFTFMLMTWKISSIFSIVTARIFERNRRFNKNSSSYVVLTSINASFTLATQLIDVAQWFPTFFVWRAIYFSWRTSRATRLIFCIPSPLRPPFSSHQSPPVQQLGLLGERCKLPIGVWGGAPADNAF